VGDPEGLHREGVFAGRIAGLQNANVGLFQEVGFFQLDLNEPSGERRAVHGDVDLMQHVRQGADVVLVTVRQEDRPESLGTFQQVGYVGDHEIDPQHLFLREHEAGVHGDDRVAVLHQEHVLADLAETA
jgi:hypothetical protein